MWKPKFKYLSGLFAKLGVFILPNGSSYQGPYHQDELGRFMTGERPGPGAELLIEDPAEKTTEQRQEEEVFSQEGLIDFDAALRDIQSQSSDTSSNEGSPNASSGLGSP